jgi:hypothetical protein
MSENSNVQNTSLQDVLRMFYEMVCDAPLDNYSDVYKHFKPEIVTITRKYGALIIKRRFDNDEKLVYAREWLDAAAKIYNIPVPILSFITADINRNNYSMSSISSHPINGCYDQINHEITLYEKISLVTLTHEFRHAMQYNVPDIKIFKGIEHDARAWSCSLFKQSLPKAHTRAIKNNLLKFK